MQRRPKVRKVGRPKLPKGEAKDRTVPVRFATAIGSYRSYGQSERTNGFRMDSEHAECRRVDHPLACIGQFISQ